MRIKNDDIQKLIDNRIIEPDKLPSKRGSCLIFLEGKKCMYGVKKIASACQKDTSGAASKGFVLSVMARAKVSSLMNEHL